ncbi:MAG: AraC family transcriptional regulator [Deltaproteobacteria bacterium]|jgi:hypothetical protein|nr:AraC family transcriptional regulator [Deltaproteobacteria bacterium]
MNQSLEYTRETVRLAGVHTLLQEKMLFWMPGEGDYCSALLCGFTATRRERLESSGGGEKTSRPLIGLVVQGSMRLEADGKQHHCEERTCFIDGMGAMGASRITAASADSPYLSLSLGLDNGMIESLIRESGFSLPFCGCSQFSFVAQADLGMLDAFLRLVNLIADPELFFCLAPLVVREIHYRMLIGPLGENIRRLHVCRRIRPYSISGCMAEYKGCRRGRSAFRP